MGENLSLDVARSRDARALYIDVVGALGLNRASDEPRLTLDQASFEIRRRTSGPRAALGLWDAATLIAVRPFYEPLPWERFPQAELVLAFDLTDNHGANNFDVFEHGERVRHWDENEPAAGEPHPLEAGLALGPKCHPADYIRVLLDRMLGLEVGGSTPSLLRLYELPTRGYRTG